MNAECAYCGSKLQRAFIISVRHFEILQSGGDATVNEVVRCPECRKIAIHWNSTDEVQFFTYEDPPRS